MAQRKQLTWTELRVGIFVLVGLFVLAIGIFYVTGGMSWGPKYTLVAYLSEVEGVQQGALVNLDGVSVGSVESIGLTSHPQDAKHSVKLVLRIAKKYQDQIRTDSTARLVSQSLLGDRYVTITRGFTGSVIPPDGEIQGAEEPAMKEIVQRSADLMTNLGALTQDVQRTVDQLQTSNGTIGKFINDPSFYNHLDSAAAKFDAMATAIQEGKGSLGKLMASNEMYDKVDRVLNDVQDMTSALRAQKGVAGRLIYDPSLSSSVKSITDNASAIISDIQQGKGTAGKLLKDDAVYSNLRDASANVRDASAKLNSNQGTLGKFFSDPLLYDNLSGLSGDMRLFMSDFRRNPKKFLHIKVSVF